MFKVTNNSITNIVITPDNKDELFTVTLSSTDQYGFHMPFQVYYSNGDFIDIVMINNDMVVFKFKNHENIKPGKIILASRDDKLVINYTPSELLNTPSVIKLDFIPKKIHKQTLYGIIECSINGIDKNWEISTEKSIYPITISKENGLGTTDLFITYNGEMGDELANFEIKSPSIGKSRMIYLKQSKIKKWLSVAKKGELV